MFSAGTVSTLPNGDLVLQSAPERYVVWIAVFLIVAPIAFLLWRRDIGGKYPPGAFIVSFIIPLFIVPGIAMDSVRVTSDALLLKTGYWFAPNLKRFPFQGLERIDEWTNVRVNGRKDLLWTFRYGASSRRLNLPDLLESNRPPVVEALRRKGVPVTTST